MARSMEFFEVRWHNEAIGDGGTLQEALSAYTTVRPEDGDWERAVAGADPCLHRFSSFEDFLDNADPVEVIPVSAAMIRAAVPPEPPASDGGLNLPAPGLN